MIKDTEFYNKESQIYSDKRYPKVPQSYVQFFFTERLKYLVRAMQKNIKDKSNLSLLEIGCADGIVLNEVQNKYSQVFSKLVGIDISPGMIKAAQEKYKDSRMVFVERKDYADSSLHDVILEIGVINYTLLSEELSYIAAHIKPDGIAIISLAGTGSLWDKRRKDETGFRTFSSYAYYEKTIREKFEIIDSISVGLPIPLLWRVPFAARLGESVAEKILRPILPNLFHEKIYVLKLVSKTQE
jgi:2-polyprenyl-3-methyl-5-hydroxy-6-metoxy-1,4-benzoquinol methylase